MTADRGGAIRNYFDVIKGASKHLTSPEVRTGHERSL
jgi:hypothetical protein